MAPCSLPMQSHLQSALYIKGTAKKNNNFCFNLLYARIHHASNLALYDEAHHVKEIYFLKCNVHIWSHFTDLPTHAHTFCLSETHVASSFLLFLNGILPVTSYVQSWKGGGGMHNSAIWHGLRTNSRGWRMDGLLPSPCLIFQLFPNKIPPLFPAWHSTRMAFNRGEGHRG